MVSILYYIKQWSLSFIILSFFHIRAAFQYGVKMNDGRKTRRQGVKNEKAKLNREWQQISQVGLQLYVNSTLNHTHILTLLILISLDTSKKEGTKIRKVSIVKKDSETSL